MSCATQQAGAAPRVALVTGAAVGIGFAIAEALAMAGHTTVLIDRSPEIVEVARALAERHDVVAEGRVADVSEESVLLDVVRGIDTRYGRLDVLVNNAGVHLKNGGRKFPIEEMTLAHWNRVVATNLTACFLLCREAFPIMKRQRWGRIVNISSRGGRTLSPIAGADYATTKAGQIGLTRVVAFEGAPFNITANCVAPGPIATPLSLETAPEVRAALARSVPLGRYGEPVEVGAAVAFLASDAASFITGAVLDVNGGTFMP